MAASMRTLVSSAGVGEVGLSYMNRSAGLYVAHSTGTARRSPRAAASDVPSSPSSSPSRGGRGGSSATTPVSGSPTARDRVLAPRCERTRPTAPSGHDLGPVTTASCPPDDCSRRRRGEAPLVDAGAPLARSDRADTAWRGLAIRLAVAIRMVAIPPTLRRGEGAVWRRGRLLGARVLDFLSLDFMSHIFPAKFSLPVPFPVSETSPFDLYNPYFSQFVFSK